MLKNLLLVSAGGAVGSVLRYLVSLLTGERNFPYATLLVNITGSFIIGMLLALGLRNMTFATGWKLFLVTGVCGGFTTFSAFSIENLQLLQNGKYLLAILYIALSIILGIGAAFGGYQLLK